TKYKDHFEKVNMKNISLPVKLCSREFNKIENQNSFTFNVFIYDEKNKMIQPYYLSKDDPQTAINILYYKKHYMHIKNFSRLMGDYNKSKAKKYVCFRCLAVKSSQDILDRHVDSCKNF